MLSLIYIIKLKVKALKPKKVTKKYQKKKQNPIKRETIHLNTKDYIALMKKAFDLQSVLI